MLAFGVKENAPEAEAVPESQSVELKRWRVSLAKSKEYPNFHDEYEMETLEPVSVKHPDFSGFIAYETEFESKGGPAVLELTDVRDCALVFLNGELQGERICPPYRFALETRPGTNKLRIEAATNLHRQVMAGDAPKFFMQPPGAAKKPSGIVGKALLKKTV